MSFSHQIQSVSNQFAASAAARTITLPVNVTAGNFIALGVTSFTSGITVTVSDNLGNTYHQAGSYAGAGVDRASVWYVFNASGGACTITVTPSASAALTLCASEHPNVLTTDPIDGTASNAATSTSATTGSIAVNGTNELIIAQLTTASSNVAHDAQNVAIICHQFNSGNEPGGLLMTIDSAAINPTVTLSSSSAWAFAGASFKTVSSGGSGGKAYIIGT